MRSSARRTSASARPEPAAKISAAGFLSWAVLAYLPLLGQALEPLFARPVADDPHESSRIVERTRAAIGPVGLSEAPDVLRILRPHVEGPPAGHTGGFGEPTCLECHLGSDVNQPGSTLEVVGLGGAYAPAESQRVTIRLLSYEMEAAGFQASFRFAEGADAGRSAGAIQPVDARTAVVQGEDGVVYVQHTSTGVPADGEAAEWTFEWTAPESPAPVWLHVAANSGNGDNSPLEDLVYTLAVELSPHE